MKEKSKPIIESLEIQICYHCNLSCRGCSHCSPLESVEFFNLDEELPKLLILKDVLDIKILKLIGGEPLQNPKITQLLRILKNNKIAREIYVATNGLLLKNMDDDFWDLVDGIEISVYNYPQYLVENIIKTVLGNFKYEHQKAFIYYYKYFREPFVKERNCNSNLVQKIYNSCLFAHDWQCFNYHKGYFFKCPQAWALAKNFKKFNIQDVGVEINENTNLQDKLLEYIYSKNPIESCSYCLGCVGKLFSIEQFDKNKWFDSIQSTAVENVDMKFIEKIEKDREVLLGTIEKIKIIKKDGCVDCE